MNPTHSQLIEENRRLREDSQRLTWLITQSCLDDCDITLNGGVLLVVTEKAVASCAGTWKDEYQEAVRKAIDATMPLLAAPEVKEGA